MGTRELAWCLLAGAAVLTAGHNSARAVDEIQVYNAAIADVGQFTIQQHLNYVFKGRRQADFPGGLISNHSLNGTPEFAYGVTDWFEAGLYLPFAVDATGQYYAQGFKFRTLFVSPEAEKRNVFYGVNFELSYNTPKFSDSAVGLEIRPIIGARAGGLEFIVNPIVDAGFGPTGQATFAPAARVAGKLAGDVWVGLEHYADLGQIGHFSRLADQSHQLFAVVDFSVGKFDINFGLGYGFTPGSDGLVAKTIIGYAFEPGRQPTSLHTPTSQRQH